jgi:two-component system response regulator RegA
MMMVCYTVNDRSDHKPTEARILLADPVETSYGPIASRLHAVGCEVLAVKTARDAAAIVRDRPIDYALLELKFEDGDCLSLIAEIRTRNPACRIVVHTWFADVKTTVAVAKAGADDLLPKPLDAEFVVEVLLNGQHLDVSSSIAFPGIEKVRRSHIEAVVRWSERNISQASRLLSLDRRSLQRLMQRYDRLP